jgi:Tfp pilus assembly protein PilX
MPNCDKRGVLVFIVLGVIMVVVILSTVTLRIVASHSRLTHHQVSRIQAQYAAKAGVIYALDKLRRNDDGVCWPPSGPFPYTRIMRSSVPAACVVIEAALPTSVSQVDITVNDPTASDLPGTQKVSATATFTYTP